MRVLAVVVLSMILFGCGREFHGNYTGNGRLTRGQQANEEQIVLALTRNGDTVTGTWTSPQLGSSGQFQATASGNNLNGVIFTIPQNNQAQSCHGSLQGTGTYSNWFLNFNLTGQMQCGQVTTAFQLTKHPN